MIKVFLLDVYENKTGVVEIDPNDLDAMYELIDCRCIDIVVRNVGDRQFDIVCDDEGLFHEPQMISAIDKTARPMLCGNLIFCHHDKDGNLTSITDDDVACLTEHMVYIFTPQFPQAYPSMGGMS